MRCICHAWDGCLQLVLCLGLLFAIVIQPLFLEPLLLLGRGRLSGLGGHGCFALDREQTSHIRRHTVVHVAARTHFALSGKLAKAKVVQLALKAAEAMVAKVVAQHFGF
jgi:hypothetical protein